MRVFLSVLILCFALPVLSGCQKQETSTLEQLTLRCNALTETDTEGRVYEPIVGKYIPKYSYTYYVSNDPTKRRYYTITIKNNKGTYTVSNPFHPPDDKPIKSAIARVFGESGPPHGKDTPPPDFDVGICVHPIHEDKSAGGVIETFTRMDSVPAAPQ